MSFDRYTSDPSFSGNGDFSDNAEYRRHQHPCPFLGSAWGARGPLFHDPFFGDHASGWRRRYLLDSFFDDFMAIPTPFTPRFHHHHPFGLLGRGDRGGATAVETKKNDSKSNKPTQERHQGQLSFPHNSFWSDASRRRATFGSFGSSTKINDTDNKFEISMNVPNNMKASDMNVELSNNEYGNKILSLSGYKKEDHTNASNSSSKAFQESKFEQRVMISDNVDVNKIKANISDGILTVSAPKMEKANKETVKITITEGPTTKASTITGNDAKQSKL